jgi:CDP-glucose 4,6-dehydratase
MENLMKSGSVDKSFWLGKRVFITGHTGFKGSWLSIWLHNLGAIVQGYSLVPKDDLNLFTLAKLNKLIKGDFCDVRNLEDLKKSIINFSPDIVFHLAAQPLVVDSYYQSAETFEINVLGTVNLFEACRGCDTIKAIINITTDKVYENNNKIVKFDEESALGGHDPYSSSKSCSELVSKCYTKSFFSNLDVGVATARAGNVIGGGDWAHNRLVPNAMKAFSDNETLVIRSPSSVRPWQHVLDPLNGYLLLAEKLFVSPNSFSGSWNFGPNDDAFKTVLEVVELISTEWVNSKWKIIESNNLYEAQELRLDVQKAFDFLGWRAKIPLKVAVKNVTNWHKMWLSGQDLFQFSSNEIEDYQV